MEEKRGRKKQDIQTHLLPEIEIRLGNEIIKTMIDTGSEISCISECLYNKLAIKDPKFFRTPTFPLWAIFVRGAFDHRSKRVTLQIHLTIFIKEIAYDISCIVIPNRVRPCIIRTNWLERHKCNMF